MPLNKKGSPISKNSYKTTERLNPKSVPISEKRRRTTGEFHNSMRDRASLTHMRQCT